MGYVFWFVLTRITTSEIVGSSAAVISFATIFTTIASIGVPSGVQRFLGKSFSEQKLQDAKVFVKASLLLTTIGTVACVIIFYSITYMMPDIFRVDFILIIVVIVFLASSVTSILFRSIIISSLNTKMLPIVVIISSMIKFALAIILVSIGLDEVGVVIGATMLPVLTSLLLAINIILIFKQSKDKSSVSFTRSLKNILISSTVSWVPAVIIMFGSQLGTVIVFGSKGASQAGIYFISFSIASAVWAVMSILTTIAYPTLSAMNDGRKKFTWRVIKLSLIIAIPVSSWSVFYSKEIMQIFGQDYLFGASTLEIFLLPTLAIGVTSGINTLAYAYGNYRQVLVIGLASSIPRTLLYFALVPIYGITGAAIGFSVGSITGFITSIVIANKIGIQLFWKNIIFILLIPHGLAFIFNFAEINYLISFVIILAVSYFLYIRLGIISRDDLQDYLTIMPDFIKNPILKILKTIDKRSKNF
jgi:O-antigen/teichoic acid export membrane protein